MSYFDSLFKVRVSPFAFQASGQKAEPCPETGSVRTANRQPTSPQTKVAKATAEPQTHTLTSKM